MKNKIYFLLIAVVLAISMWLLMVLLRPQVSYVKIPFELINIPDNMCDISPELEELEFKITARGGDIVMFQLANPQITLDAANYDKGMNRIAISHENIDYPQHLSIEFTQKKQIIMINMDSISEKTVPVKEKFRSEAVRNLYLKRGYALKDKLVQLNGPSTYLASISNIYTCVIEEKMLNADTLYVELAGRLAKLRMDKQKVQIIQSKQKKIERVVSFIPIKHDTQLFSIIPQTVSIKISGEENVVKALEKSRIEVKIGARHNGVAKLNISLPPALKLLEYTPQTVRVKKKND